MENNTKEKAHQIKISSSSNEKLESLLHHIKEVEPLSRVNKQKLVELGIQKLSESDATSLVAKCKNRKAMVMEYLKKDKHISNPDALVDLLRE
jgi:hypothetical protein